MKALPCQHVFPTQTMEGTGLSSPSYPSDGCSLGECRHLEEHGVVSYGEVTRHTLGRSGQRLVDSLLIISQTGTGCTAPYSGCHEQ